MVVCRSLVFYCRFIASLLNVWLTLSSVFWKIICCLCWFWLHVLLETWCCMEIEHNVGFIPSASPFLFISATDVFLLSCYCATASQLNESPVSVSVSQMVSPVFQHFCLHKSLLLNFSGLVAHSDLDERAIEALKEFNEDGALQVLVQFKESDLSHVQVSRSEVIWLLLYSSSRSRWMCVCDTLLLSFRTKVPFSVG